jgi:hypothetical protein
MQDKACAEQQVPQAYLIHGEALELASIENLITDKKLDPLLWNQHSKIVDGSLIKQNYEY